MAGPAECQTRPIANAHHKTHGYDVRSFHSTRGQSRSSRAWISPGLSSFSALITCRSSQHLDSASIIHRRISLVAVAPAASRSPSPHLNHAATRQQQKRRRRPSQPRRRRTSHAVRWRRYCGSHDKNHNIPQGPTVVHRQDTGQDQGAYPQTLPSRIRFRIE
jgi:hypothetical protein